MRDHFATFRKSNMVSPAPAPSESAKQFGTSSPEGGAESVQFLDALPADEIEERIAMALEGGVPALYAPAFAKMQGMIRHQIGHCVRSERAVDDAGRFLDA